MKFRQKKENHGYLMDDHYATTNHVVVIAHIWMHGVTSNFLFFIFCFGLGFVQWLMS